MTRTSDLIEQVDRDLAEVDAQVAAGELDGATAERLRDSYRKERAALLAAATEPAVSGRSRQRTLAGGAILVIGVAIIAGLAIFSLRSDTPDVPGGVDLASVSTEEMEAVVAANPEVIGMRLALAERYVEAGRHSEALDHYLTVLDQDPEQPEALAMVGWLTYLAGEYELARPFVDKALSIEPNYPSAWWFLANIRVSIGDLEGAAAALDRLLVFDLPTEARDAAERLLAEVRP